MSEQSNETLSGSLEVHTASPPYQQPDQPKGLNNAWLASDEKFCGAFLFMCVLQPAPQLWVGLADQNAVAQLWTAKERGRYFRKAVLLRGVLDGSRKLQEALRGKKWESPF